MTHSNTKPLSLSNIRIVGDSDLIWLDANINETEEKYRNIIKKLQIVFKNVKTFTNADECVDFITDINENIFMIISHEFEQTIGFILQSLSRVNCVYIFSENDIQYKKSEKELLNLFDLYTDITLICEALEKTTNYCDSNPNPTTIVQTTDTTMKQNLHKLDPTSMYIQILLKILLTIPVDEKHIYELIPYPSNQDMDPNKDKKFLKILRKYNEHIPIHLYVENGSRSSMLNKALRTMELDVIVKMGFFFRDLHNHISLLHWTQKRDGEFQTPFIVYRGQGFSPGDFDCLKNKLGGWLSFNNFLSTSRDSSVSWIYATSSASHHNMIGVLLEIYVDPSTSSAVFAWIGDISRFKWEKEIVFNPHAVFRIDEISQSKKNKRIWVVKLTLIDNNDSQLQALAERIYVETSGPTGWFQIGRLMNKVGHFDNAEQLFQIILDQTTEEIQKGEIYRQLGSIKAHQGKYAEALYFYEKAFVIQHKTIPADHPELAILYNNIGVVHDKMGKYKKALSYYEKAFEIQRKTFNRDDHNLAISYSNMGLWYCNTGEYRKALLYHKKALQIQQQSLPDNHPDLATAYNHIGVVYENMGQYLKAFSSYRKAVLLRRNVLPENHPDLGISYNNIGRLYYRIGQYLKAYSFCQTAVLIQQKVLCENHPDLASSYNNIGLVYNTLGVYIKALSFYEKALEIQQHSLPSNHCCLAQSHNNIGLVHSKMANYQQALSSYKRALGIQRVTLPNNHPDLATSYNNIGVAYNKMGEYTEALRYYYYVLDIQYRTLTSIHPDLAISFNNIGTMYYNMSKLSKALPFFEKALEIRQQTLDANHPCLATSYNNIGLIYEKISQHSKALLFYQKVIDIQEATLFENHPDLAVTYNNLAGTYCSMGKYSEALSFYKKALDIDKKSLPNNHSNLAACYNQIGVVHINMREFSEALSFCEKALQIQQQSLPSDHPDLANSYNNLGVIHNNMENFSGALQFYQQALEIQQRIVPMNRFLLAIIYNNMGGVYYRMRQYTTALTYYRRALEIKKEILPANHLSLITAYKNIAAVYYSMGECSNVSLFYEKAAEIERKLVSQNDNYSEDQPVDDDMLRSEMCKISEAFQFRQSTFSIQEETVSSNNLLPATSGEEIAEIERKPVPQNVNYSKDQSIDDDMLHSKMCEILEALRFSEKESSIQEETVPSNNLLPITSDEMIVEKDRNMSKIVTADQFDREADAIQERTRPGDHPDLATSYNNIGAVYSKIDHLAAFSFFIDTIQPSKNIRPDNHADLAIFYTNIGEDHYNRGDYVTALTYYQKALKIKEQTFPTNYSDLIAAYNNIGKVYDSMGDLSKALSFYQKAFEAQQRLLLNRYEQLVSKRFASSIPYGFELDEKSFAINASKFLPKILRNDLTKVDFFRGESSLFIQLRGSPTLMEEKGTGYTTQPHEKTFNPNHPDIVPFSNDTGGSYFNKDDYANALSSYQQVLKIQQETLPSDHPDLATTYNNIGALYYSMGKYEKANLSFEEALEIQQKNLSKNGSDLPSSPDAKDLIQREKDKIAKHENRNSLKSINPNTIGENSPTSKENSRNVARTSGR